jgi:hypothetical protein
MGYGYYPKATLERFRDLVTAASWTTWAGSTPNKRRSYPAEVLTPAEEPHQS